MLPSGDQEQRVLLALCQTLVVSGALAGLRMSDASPEECVASVLAPTPSPGEINDVHQARLARAARGEEARGRAMSPNREAVRHLLLRHVAFTQNEGAPQAVDFERLATPAATALKDWMVPSEEALPALFKPYLESLKRAIEVSLPEAVKAATRWWETVRLHLSGADTAAELASRASAAVVRARQAGLLSDPELADPARSVITIADRIVQGEVPVDLGKVNEVGNAIETIIPEDLRSNLESLQSYYQHLKPFNALGSLITKSLTALAGAESQASRMLTGSVTNSGAGSPTAAVKRAADAVSRLKGELG